MNNHRTNKIESLKSELKSLADQINLIHWQQRSGIIVSSAKLRAEFGKKSKELFYLKRKAGLL